MPVSVSVKSPRRVAAFSCTLTVCFTQFAASSTFLAVKKKRKVETRVATTGPATTITPLLRSERFWARDLM